MADNELVRVAMLESDIVHGDHINIQGINKERKERANMKIIKKKIPDLLMATSNRWRLCGGWLYL